MRTLVQIRAIPVLFFVILIGVSLLASGSGLGALNLSVGSIYPTIAHEREYLLYTALLLAICLYPLVSGSTRNKAIFFFLASLSFALAGLKVALLSIAGVLDFRTWLALGVAGYSLVVLYNVAEDISQCTYVLTILGISSAFLYQVVARAPSL